MSTLPNGSVFAIISGINQSSLPSTCKTRVCLCLCLCLCLSLRHDMHFPFAIQLLILK